MTPDEAVAASALRLAAARAAGHGAGVAEALAVHANALIRAGRTEEASRALDEAAGLHQQDGRPYDEARCSQLAATLCRFLGRLEDARRRATRASELAGAAGPVGVAALAELGEIALAGGRHADAAEAFGRAIDSAQTANLGGPAQAALLRRRAISLAVLTRRPEALRDLQAAHAALAAAGDRPAATRTLIEQATVLRDSGRPAEAERRVAEAMAAAEGANDRAALADLWLLRAARSLDLHDPAAALSASQAARSNALAANAPASYLAASLAVAQLTETAGNRLEAYESLASGWVTLADAVGAPAARAAFEPKLREMRDRWGSDAFAAVKKTYEARALERKWRLNRGDPPG